MLVPFELPAELTAYCLAGKDPFDDRPGVVRVVRGEKYSHTSAVAFDDTKRLHALEALR